MTWPPSQLEWEKILERLPAEARAATRTAIIDPYARWVADLTAHMYRHGNCPGCGLGSEQAEGIRQGCRIAGQGVDDGPALLLGG